jgi:His Kinase A (phospho-acceptor) domain
MKLQTNTQLPTHAICAWYLYNIFLFSPQAYADMFSHYIGPDENPMEPVSDIFYPIIDTMATAVSVHENPGDGNGNSFAHPHHYHPSEHQVYGILAVSIYWRDMIKRILPTDSNGIVVVFENDCNKPFTYQIDGPKVTFLGHGDLHDNHYDGYVQSTRLDDLSISHHEGPSRTYTGIPVNSDYCTTTVNVYPSQEMESDYTSSKPILFAVAAVSIFAVTSAVFLIYDRWVEKRQCKVVATALDAAMNVSLLEEKVQERTKSLEESNQQLEEANRQVTGASAAQLQHFASMSHEIRTPLNCVVGLSSILVDDANLTSKQTESLRMILNSAELLRSVVDEYVSFKLACLE